MKIPFKTTRAPRAGAPAPGGTEEDARILATALTAEDTLLSQPELSDQLQARIDAPAARARARRDNRLNPAADLPAKMRNIPAATAILQRHCRDECSLEETILELYHTGLSLHDAEKVAATLWGGNVNLTAIGNFSREIAQRIEAWLSRPLPGYYACVFFDSIQLARRGDGRKKSLRLLLAVGINPQGFREVLGVTEAAAETLNPWSAFLQQLRQRGLSWVKLCVGGFHPDLMRSTAAAFPGATYQGCIFQLHREVLALVPAAQAYLAMQALQPIHASDNREEAQARTMQAAAQLHRLNLPQAAELLGRIGESTFAYYSLPPDQWRRLNNTEPLRTILRKLRERTRVLGAISNSETAVLLLAARARHIMRVTWGGRRFVNFMRIA